MKGCSLGLPGVLRRPWPYGRQVVVWQSLDRVWRVEEHNGTWTIRMHTALVAEARSKPEAERWLQELDGPALDEMRRT